MVERSSGSDAGVRRSSLLVTALAAGLLLFCYSVSCAHAERRHASGGGFEVQAFGAIWDDPERCQARIALGQRLSRRPGHLRVASWNIKWFPDGQPGQHADKHGGTDISWLACAITYLDADVLALQEIKLTPRGLAAEKELAEKLEKQSGAKWQWENDGCADPYRQHVAFLFRSDRVLLSHRRTDAEIDPTVSRSHEKDPLCPGNLRPALAAYVKSKMGGVDFHLVTSHLDSGTGVRDFDNRRAAWQRLAGIYAKRQELVADSDFVFIGDWNSMGCKACGVADAAAEEKALSETLRQLAPPMLLAESNISCSHYYRTHGALLDHVAYTRSMRESYGATQVVTGVCAKSQCARLHDDQTPVFNRLSDHCPVVFDIEDADRDEPLAASSAP